METIYKQIGIDTIKTAVENFYERAFKDPIIGYFFIGKNHQELISKQINFTASMLGSTSHPYKGKSLEAAHHKLKIRKAHFGRRSVLMREVLEELNLEKKIIQKWLEKENRLYDKIVARS